MSNTIANVSDPDESWRRLRGEQLGQAVLRDRAERVASGKREIDNVGDAKRYGVSADAVSKAVNRLKRTNGDDIEDGANAASPARTVDPVEIVEVPFYKGVVLGVLLDGVAYAFLKPILDDLGIGISSQLEKARGYWWETCMRLIRTQVPGAAQTRVHVVISTEALGMLLANVNDKKVRTESRELLIKLQREVARVVHDHLTGKQQKAVEGGVDPRYASDPLYQMITKVIDNGYQILSLKERQEATDGKVVEVSAEVQKVKQEVVELREDLAPKVKSWQHLVDDKGGIELAVAAQSFNFTPPGKKASGRTTFNEYLRQLGWLCHNEAGFMGTRPTQNAVNHGWMEAKRVWLDGPGHYINQAFLTPRGYEKLEKIISTR